jgi:hypothetical protein
LIALILSTAIAGCQKDGVTPPKPMNHSPVIDSIIAVPDSLGPSDSTIVSCFASDIDGDTLVYDWHTDARLNIQGTPTWNKHLNAQRSPYHTFYNADLPNRINDSAWVYCEVHDRIGGGASARVYIILRDN